MGKTTHGYDPSTNTIVHFIRLSLSFSFSRSVLRAAAEWALQIHWPRTRSVRRTQSINITGYYRNHSSKSTLLHEPNAQFGFSRVAAAPQLHIVRISQAHRKSRKYSKFFFLFTILKKKLYILTKSMGKKSTKN